MQTMKKNIEPHYLIHKSTNALNKIKFVISIKLLRVSALGCHFQEVLHVQGIKSQHDNLNTIALTGMIKNLKF